MPRKPKREKQTITIIVNGVPVTVILHPPSGTRKTWYAYWNGLATSRSTGQRNLEDAILVVENMVKNGGRKADLQDAVLSDEEFEEIQRAHFEKKTDPAAKGRALKTLEDCLDAIAAFREISGLNPIASASPDDCEQFQRQALKLPKNWRKSFPKSRKEVENLSPNTVLKWSRSLQAAFERVNRTAGKKCVRGVVEEQKLLVANPWNQFTWIAGTERPIRQFDGDELLSLMSFLETSWKGVSAGATAAKVFLWSGCRKSEIAGLTWDSLRIVNQEYHFEVIGKWGVERWFRLPEAVYRELLDIRTESPFVFAAYCDQIRQVHVDNAGCLRKIKAEFSPNNFGRWFYERIKEWSATHPRGRAFVHHFRKTALQLALDGEEDASQRVAQDVGVGEGVLLSHYVKPKLWRRSNRTYSRILASLPPEVARRYGLIEEERSELEKRLRVAIEAKDWSLVNALAARLGQTQRPEAG